MISKKEIGADSLKQFKQLVDLGDHLFIKGRVIASKTGELSVFATEWAIAAKALQPLPALHKELNEDTRTRKPYIGMIADEKIRNMVRNRSKAVASLRKTFADHDFLEVETPMLQTVHGGAAARPFTTHMNAFDLDLYLRIAPELFLKRCLVGGIDRVSKSTATSATRASTLPTHRNSPWSRPTRPTATTTPSVRSSSSSCRTPPWTCSAATR